MLAFSFPLRNRPNLDASKGTLSIPCPRGSNLAKSGRFTASSQYSRCFGQPHTTHRTRPARAPRSTSRGAHISNRFINGWQYTGPGASDNLTQLTVPGQPRPEDPHQDGPISLFMASQGARCFGQPRTVHRTCSGRTPSSSHRRTRTCVPPYPEVGASQHSPCVDRANASVSPSPLN